MKPQTQNSTTALTEHTIVSPAPRSHSVVRKKPPATERGIWDYVYMLKRRWKMIAAISLGTFLLAAGVIMLLPASYQADVLVMLQAPNVNAGTSVVAAPDMLKKLDALREQVESRRTLDQVINKFDLFADKRGTMPQEEMYAAMRKNIKLKMGKSSFNIFYEHENPQTAADVANEIARHYIEENARLRRDALNKTSSFILSQLTRLKRDVNDTAKEMQDFRYKYQGMLPEDVPANQALLISLSSQVSQTEATMDSDRLRKRKVEDRITELLGAEIALRHKNIRTMGATLKKMPTAAELSGDPKAVDPIPASFDVSHDPQPADVRPKDAGSERKALEERLQQIDIAIARAAPQVNTPNGNVDTPEVVRLKKEKGEIRAKLDNADVNSAAESFAPNLNIPDGEVAVDVEVEIQKQLLKQEEAVTEAAERNAKDNDELYRKGIVSSIVAARARTEADAAKAKLGIARARVLQARNNLGEKLKTAEGELLALNRFQEFWSEMLIKIQEIEAQHLRISGQSSQEDVADANKRIEKLMVDLARMRETQSDISRQLGAARELAQQVVEHENIMVSLTRQQKDVLSIKTRVADLERRLIASAAVQVQMPELLRKSKLINDQYEVMLKHKMEADLQMGVEDQQEGERMIIWDAAIAPMMPFRPKYMMLFAGGLMGALSLGIAIALLLELMAPKFLNTESLQNYAGMDVLAEVDKLPSKEVPSPLPEGMPASCAKVITLSDPWHRISRQFMDTSCLMFKRQGNKPRVVAVCSPGHGDGKTFVAANLAAALALSTKQPTLLVDANLRSPTLHTMFDKPLESGLAEALEGGPIHVHPVPSSLPCDLQLLTAGQAQQHGAVLLASVRFREMMDKLSYQGTKPHIILDTPPLRAGADVDVLLDGVDGVLLVVRRGHTPMTEVTRALRRIHPSKLLGVIFNDNIPA
jgi:protein-tyrosine kinase